MALPNLTSLRWRETDEVGVDGVRADNWKEPTDTQGLPCILLGPDGQALILRNNRVPMSAGTPTHVSGQTTNVCKEGKGVLRRLVMNTPVATAVITITDGILQAGAVVGTVIGVITVPASPQAYTLYFDAEFNAGLIVVQATASSDFTVVVE